VPVRCRLWVGEGAESGRKEEMVVWGGGYGSRQEIGDSQALVGYGETHGKIVCGDGRISKGRGSGGRVPGEKKKGQKLTWL